MSGTRLRSPVVLLALGACVCAATTRGIGTVPIPARQPPVTTNVVYGWFASLLDCTAALFFSTRLF
jgi:hypothetical protein